MKPAHVTRSSDKQPIQHEHPKIPRRRRLSDQLRRSLYCRAGSPILASTESKCRRPKEGGPDCFLESPGSQRYRHCADERLQRLQFLQCAQLRQPSERMRWSTTATSAEKERVSAVPRWPPREPDPTDWTTVVAAFSTSPNLSPGEMQIVPTTQTQIVLSQPPTGGSPRRLRSTVIEPAGSCFRL